MKQTGSLSLYSSTVGRQEPAGVCNKFICVSRRPWRQSARSTRPLPLALALEGSWPFSGRRGPSSEPGTTWRGSTCGWRHKEAINILPISRRTTTTTAGGIHWFNIHTHTGGAFPSIHRGVVGMKITALSMCNGGLTSSF